MVLLISARSILTFRAGFLLRATHKRFVVTSIIGHRIIDGLRRLIRFLGQCVLACRPRYVHDILQRKLPTTLLVGKPDCGKSYLMELALLVVGTDRIDGRAFSYSHITAHEFGKRALRSTVPMLVNDPRTESAKDYALLIQQVSEGDTHQTNALTYNPGAGPLLSTNGDFMHALKRMNKDAWWFIL